MAQIFHRSANTIARASIIGVVMVVSVVLWAALEMQRSPYATYQDVAQAQPVPFSHQHHVGRRRHRLPLLPHLGRELQLRRHSSHQDLHELSLADLDERSHAGAGARELPHRQVAEWTRVNYLPDFVYFNHSIHVNKGVGCASCHGPVDKMPLMYAANSLQHGVVFELPPRAGEVPAAARPGVQHEVRAAQRRQPVKVATALLIPTRSHWATS